MTALSILTERAIDQAFLTALLLTGSAELAEDAVVDALDVWDESEEDEALLHAAARAAVAPRGGAKTARYEDAESAVSLLPMELRGILRLSSERRQCLVLRVLVGLSRRACARVLEMHVRQVDRLTTAALEEMPFLQQPIGRAARAASGFRLRIVENPR
jgi:DNA-directed RNA polymerase specialized sigma24 family protein